MAGVNKVIILGNLGADPEVRHLESGSKVATLSIATSDTYTKNGEKITDTEWHRVEMWDKLAELAEQYLQKGSQVYVEGKIKTNQYTDKEGVKRYDKRIRATTMTFVGGKQDAQPGQQAQGQYEASSAGYNEDQFSKPIKAASAAVEHEVDELPF